MHPALVVIGSDRRLAREHRSGCVAAGQIDEGVHPRTELARIPWGVQMEFKGISNGVRRGFRRRFPETFDETPKGILDKVRVGIPRMFRGSSRWCSRSTSWWSPRGSSLNVPQEVHLNSLWISTGRRTLRGRACLILFSECIGFLDHTRMRFGRYVCEPGFELPSRVGNHSADWPARWSPDVPRHE